MESVLVPLCIFGCITAVILVPQFLKSRDRQRMFEMMQQAQERGQPVSPDFMEAMTRNTAVSMQAMSAAAVTLQPPGERDLRRGVIWTAIGVGLFLIGLVGYFARYGVSADEHGVDWFNSFVFLAAIPFCVGIAFLILFFVTRSKAKAA